MKKWMVIILTVISVVAYAGDWVGSADIKFKGTSTLHDFDGKAPIKELSLTIAPSKDNKDRLLSADAVLKIIDMDTDNGSRDKKMRKMFNVDKFPQISGKVVDAPISKIKPEKDKFGSLPSTFTIHGVTNQVDGMVISWNETPEKLTFTSVHIVSLKAFKLKAPTAMGFIKVGDSVTVTLTVTATPTPAADVPQKEQ